MPSNPGSGFSGVNGTAKYGSGSAVEICEVKKWTFNPRTNVPAYASNKTEGFKAKKAGVRDSSGMIECVIDGSGNVPFYDGDSVLLELHVDGTGNNYFAVNAVIEGAPVDCDIDNGEIVTMNFEFQGSGSWTGYGILSPLNGSSGN